MNVYKKTTQGQGKNHLKGLGKVLHGAHTSIKIVSATTTEEWKVL